MMRRTPRMLILAVIALLVAAVATTVAGAHTSSTHYPAHWIGLTSVPYRFESAVPTGAFRDRLKDGAAQWTAQGGTAEPNFYWPGGDDFPDTSLTGHCNTGFYGANVLQYQDLDNYGSGVLGVTLTCYRTDTGEILSFQMGFDNDRDWYTGTGDANDGFLNQCIPSCQSDLWSVASHEFGHATGFMGPSSTGGHFSSTDAVCADNDSQATMCPSYKPGTERQRSLSTHDIHTFTGAY